MIDPIVLAGPASPQRLAKWLDSEDRERALATPGLGGPALTGLVEAFLETGAAVELVTLAPELEDGPMILEGPRLRILTGCYRPRARHRGRDFLRQERRGVRDLLSQTSGSVINAHWPYEFALGATSFRKRPVVVTLHDAPLTVLRYQPDAYRAIGLAMAAATRLRRVTLTAVSADTAAKWRKQMLDRRPIRIIPNVVPIPTSKTRSVESAEHRVILEVASDSPLKNVAALVRAMTTILSTNSRVRLILAGPGLTPDSDLYRLAEQLGVSQSIDFCGEVDRARLDTLFRTATVFVHASREESFGMSIAEAMSFGLPVVGGKSSGDVPELLDDGRAGVLVDTDDAASIAAAVSSLLEDEGRRKKLGEAARQRVVSQCSASAVTAAYLDVYEQAAAWVR
jgi:glycosyltransferase involved in cell wall biosynthesis